MTFHRDRPDDRDAYLDEWIKVALDAELAGMDAGFDFPAGLRDVYARAAQAESMAVESSGGLRPGTEAQGGLRGVVTHIEMLDALLGAVSTSEVETSPQQGVMYLRMARQFLLQLRIGLSSRRLPQGRAIQLVEAIAHNVAETDRILRAQQGVSLQDAVRARVGELRDISGDLTQQTLWLREKVLRLFTDVDELASRFPIPTR